VVVVVVLAAGDLFAGGAARSLVGQTTRPATVLWVLVVVTGGQAAAHAPKQADLVPWSASNA